MFHQLDAIDVSLNNLLVFVVDLVCQCRETVKFWIAHSTEITFSSCTEIRRRHWDSLRLKGERKENNKQISDLVARSIM